MIDDLLPRVEDDFHRSGLHFSLAALAAYRGEKAAAYAYLGEVESRLQVERMVAEQTWHLRVLSLVKLLLGDISGAYDDGKQAVTMDPTGMNTPNSVVQCAHAAAWLRDAAKLQDTAVAMRPLTGAWIANQQVAVRAALDALSGETTAAVAAYDRLLEEWGRAELPLDHAWTVVDALAVLPRERMPARHVDVARTTLTQLRAQPLLDRLDAGVATG
jgi:hypothetical protein